MPRLSDSMEEGTIIRWLKESGALVLAGEELVEIETDKATVAYEAEDSGVLTIVATDGDTLPVGAVIGRIADHADAAGTVIAAREHRSSAPERANASPVARRLAERLGVVLATVSGTGPSGRIVKRDVHTAAAATRDGAVERAGPRAAEQPQAETNALKGAVQFQPASRLQATIARRMVQAKTTTPDFTLSTEVGMDAAIRLRSELAELEPERLPTLGDFVVKACALALRRHPRVNASYRDGGFEIYERVNVGVAVAAPDALLVPTVFDADAKSLGRIASDTEELAARARAGQLTPPELSGATFTVSNLGMYGITQFTAVLNPPQAAILAVGSVEPRVRIEDGEIVSCHLMNLTMTCDHRILYGADAAAFLQSVRAELERPLRLVM